MKKKVLNILKTLILITYVLGALGIGLTIIVYAFIWGWKALITFFAGSFFIYLGTIALILVNDKLKK